MSILKTPLSRRSSIARVHFALPTDMRPLLLDFSSGANTKPYEQLVATLNDATQSDGQKINMLQNCCKVVGLLDQQAERLVHMLLLMDWMSGSEALVQAYQLFAVELLAAHNYYTKPFLQNFMEKFKTYTAGGTEPWCGVEPPEELRQPFNRIHEVIARILKIIPMAGELLVQLAVSGFPFMKRSPLEHQSFIYNLLRVCEYEPSLRFELLNAIVNKMLALDVQIPRELLEEDAEDEDDMEMDDSTTVFAMDDLQSAGSQQSTNGVNMHQSGIHLPLACSLDKMMEQVLGFIKRHCEQDTSPSSWQHHRELYRELSIVFEKQLLLTHGSHHVQFIMFYMCSLRPTSFIEHFLGSLWTLVSKPCETTVARQSAACYVASLLARARFVTPRLVRSMLAQMADWCHAYIAAQQDAVVCDTRQHAVFYTVCQALFYVVAFRHADLVNSTKGLMWTQSLGLGKLVTSRLNPLKPCLPGVAQNFAAVTRTYQLAYCYTVLERNARAALPCVNHSGQTLSTTLNTFFPFDPYLLDRSSHYINPEYRQYEALEQPAGTPSVEAGSDGEEAEEEEEEEEEEEDYDMSPHKTITKSPGSLHHLVSPSAFPDIFNYGSSPGFKHL